MFAFHPELFESKATAQEALEAAGVTWFVDYSSCDLLHDEYGLEVDGIRSQQIAREVLTILRHTFPEWGQSSIWYKDRRPGCWCVAHAKYR